METCESPTSLKVLECQTVLVTQVFLFLYNKWVFIYGGAKQEKSVVFKELPHQWYQYKSCVE